MSSSEEFSRYDKLKLIGLSIEAFSGVIGASLIMSQKYPIITVIVLAVGAVANRVVSYMKEKEAKNIVSNLKQTQNELS
jgi:hypothetical protein